MTDNFDPHSDEARLQILENIREYGCHIVVIEPDNYSPGFVYSIGLYQQYRHPEIICLGLNAEVAASLINDACERIKNGETFSPNKEYPEFLEDHNVQFLPVAQEHYADYVGYAAWFYDMTVDFPVLQLVWPDKESNYPWNEEADSQFKLMQPLLDRNTDFKFYEERNLGVYTTRQAFSGDPILYVFHNEDGNWQFHTSEEPDLKDSMYVCLEEIVRLDPSIKELFRLQYGWRAWRNDVHSEWEMEEYASDSSGDA